MQPGLLALLLGTCMQIKKTIQDLSSEDTLWIFHGDQKLGEEQKEIINTKLGKFVEKWMSEGKTMYANFEIIYDQFIIIYAENPDNYISGCAKDALHGFIQLLEKKTGVSFMDRTLIFYRDNKNEIQAVKRPQFMSAAKAGSVSPETTVFDTTVHSVGDYLNSKWELQAKDTWHSRFF